MVDRYCSVGVLLVLVAGCAPAPAVRPADMPGATAAAAPTEILWDSYGVPHIFAPDDLAAVHAFGWAQMQNHGDLILRLFAQARGRAAEYLGAAYAAGDVQVRTYGIPRRGAQWYAVQDTFTRALIDAFATGMNDYAAAHGDALAPALRAVLPVTGADVLAHINRVAHFTFAARPQVISAVVRGFTQQSAPAGPPAPPPGSNGWAIAPSRSASDHALLLANPHLPWGDLYTFFEAHIVSPSLSVYGATLVGMPLPVIAFNDSLGWTHTVNTISASDIYALELSGDGYVFDGRVRRFEIEHEVLRVRQDDGSLVSRPLAVRHSLHGPVIAERAGAALALRVAGLDRPGFLAQYWQMLTARNHAEFEHALRRLEVPLFTVLYADVHGRIMHLFNGTVPRRPEGDWAFWTRIVPGTTSRTLWTDVHAYDELPRVVDPPTGWLQNANDPPWTTTVPLVLDPDDYPPYMAPRGMAFRPQRSARMLAEDDAVSFDALVAYKHDTRMELADRIVDDVIAAARAHGTPRAQQAADVLAAWDRTADAASRGGVLFQQFMQEAQARVARGAALFAVPWSAADPLGTPRGLADPAAAAVALDVAATAVESRFGRSDVAWGDVHRIRLGDVDMPASGGSGAHGEFRVLGFDRSPDGRFHAVAGDSYIAAIEFSRPIRARALMTYGNASQPGSPHRTDQLEIFARKQLREVWLTREDIEANLVRIQRLPVARE